MKLLFHSCILVGILLLSACGPFQTPVAELPAPKPASEIETASPDFPANSSDDLHNAAYQLGLPDMVEIVQLTNGYYEEGSAGRDDFLSVSVTEYIARGDLTDDGIDEAVALISETYGDSGTFVFLAVYTYQNDLPVFVTSIYLDDQPIMKELLVENGEIFVDAIIHARKDPLCCPTLATTRHYLLNGINLILTDYSSRTPAGEPRVITLEAPVDGAQVSGIVRLKGSVSIAPFENNLVYRIQDLGGVELSVGPISVNSQDIGAPGNFEKAIDLGNILTNTAVRISVEDINMEDGSLFAMDSVILRIR